MILPVISFYVVVSSFFCVGFMKVTESNISKRNESADGFEDAYYPALHWSDEFDWKLFKSVNGDGSNVLISPLSLKIALAIIYEGAAGLTETEFQDVLNFQSKESVRLHYSNIIKSLKNGDGVNEIRLATRLFLDTDIIPSQKYSANVNASYNAEVEPTNFVVPDKASQKINNWASEETNGYISNIISQDDLEDVVLLVANAVFFKGFWKKAFPKNNTGLGNFYTTPTSLVTVEYMNTIGNYYYADSKDLEAQILRIPYKGNKFGFFVILPYSKDGLPKLIKSLDFAKLKSNMYKLDSLVVDVRIPKFRFNFISSYASILQKFGLQHMFSDGASLPGISHGVGYGYKKLQVNDIRQKGGIEISEDGSTIFAATEIHVGNKFGDVDNIFNASYPFMFFVEDQTSGTIIFIGKVVNPLATEPIAVPVRIGEAPNANVVAPSITAAQNAQSGSEIQLGPIVESDNSIQSRFNYFDLELLRTFGSEGNYLISPASLKTTLGMILEGSKGKSAEEIAELLRVPVSQKGIRDRLQRLLYDLTDKSGSTVLISSNALFLSDSFSVLPLFRDTLLSFYNAKVKMLNFSKQIESAGFVNKWVSEATQGQISELVDSGSFDATLSAIIANALYFKGNWKEAFNPNGTYEHKCFKVKGVCHPVQMMHVVGNFKYKFIEELDAAAVELPYNDDKYAMLILLPNDKSTVEGLIRDLQHVSFSHVIDVLEKAEVLVEIPKFELEYSADMVPPLTSLGLRNVFGQNADLSGITENGNIKIDSIIHKTKISVNEEGTVASAATGAVVVPLMGLTVPEVKADRPFLFFIYHVESKNIIFEGRLNQPGNSQNQFSSHNYQGHVPLSDLRNQRVPTKGHVQSRFSNQGYYYPLETYRNADTTRKGGSLYGY
ncbi:uncharacterized protein LOC108740504 [Agrilus planipennis]|uniref:Uncharacterized protein LOC108740504 n=1 Tax=Agrilus planipennis TaxID=224129 RepID=A0A1W4XD30_AGRPL|nr:uncharacterized protein LOC108740504 [Agrilus planipennis]